MKKKLLVFLLTAALAAALTGCNNETSNNTSTDTSSAAAAGDETVATSEAAEQTENSSENKGEVSISDGIYEETGIGLKTFYRFNEDGTYYAYFFDGGAMEAGTYEILDKETAYRPEGKDETAEASETAPQTIVTTSYDGKTTEIAYADDTLMDCSLAGMSHHRFFHHNAEYPYDPDNDEKAIAVYTFYADNKAGNTLTLYHNLTFVDYTGDRGTEGTWEKVSDTEFTLTDEDGNIKTLTVDGRNATYGDMALTDSVVEEGEATVINTYRVDEAQVGLPMPVALRIDCYSDSTCKFVVEVAAVNTEIIADEGTYELDATVFTPTFHFKNLGDIVSEPDYASATESGINASITVQGAMDVTDNDGNVTPMTFDSVLTGTASPSAAPTSSAAAE